MKRLFVKTLLATVALGVVGVASAQDIKERTIKFGTVGAENHPSVPGMKKFKELVEAKSGGKIKVNLFYNGTLGSDQAVVTAMQGGTIEMSVMNTGILSSVAKELAVFDFPFLFANEKESDALVDGPVGRKLHAKLEEKGLVGLSYWELGYRHITNSKRPINKVEDLEGLKLRVIPNPINVAWVKALGANPTPMPFPEVYGGLEQKAIDGQENPVAVIASSKLYEVQKHIVMSNHQYNPQSVLMSKKFFDGLSAAEKKIVDDSADEAAKSQRSASRAAVAANLDLLKKNGMQVTEFSPAEVAKLRDKMKPVIVQFTANVGDATVNEVMGELAKMRK
jgi:tripartite ATP-independent transporter DctP family solute receptor